MKDVNVLELFSGIGGFSLGIERAGYKIKNHYFSEVDKHAIANYKHNFKKSIYVGAVENVRGIKADIVTFGSPCQDFSLAGKRKGMEGERSSLITEAIRIVRETRPSVFVWENVKGAFSSNSGADFWGIIAAFADIGGYRLEWQLLNTSWFLPQNRERIYLVGHLADRSKPGVFPFTETDSRAFEGSTKTAIARAFTAGGNSGGHHSSMTLVKTLSNSETLNTIRSGGRGSLTKKHSWDVVKVNQINEAKEFGDQPQQQNIVYDSNGVMPALTSCEKNNIKVQPVLTPDRKEKRQNGRRFKNDGEPSFTLSTQDQHGVMITSNTKKGHEELKEGDSLNFSVPTSKTRRGRVGKGKAQTLDTACNQGVIISHYGHKNKPAVFSDKSPTLKAESHGHEPMTIQDTQIRRLTEIECERLQGFPDGWTKYGDFDGETKEISKTQRYKMCGNAVTVDVVKAIFERIELL